VPCSASCSVGLMLTGALLSALLHLLSAQETLSFSAMARTERAEAYLGKCPPSACGVRGVHGEGAGQYCWEVCHALCHLDD
jgi:hypothetical protein